MNKTVTSKEDILKAGKQIVAENGLQAINMRLVAERCGVAVGSVYNYFSSKNDLTVAIVEAVWNEIIGDVSVCGLEYDFLENVKSLFCSIKRSGEKYPLFFSDHSAVLAQHGKEQGRAVMESYFKIIKTKLFTSLQNDRRINDSFFSEKCTQTDFVDFVFSNLLSLLIQNKKSCDVLTEIIKSAIY